MKRFVLSPHALIDLKEIIVYLNGLPDKPALRIGKEIQSTLYRLASNPNQGFVHENFTARRGVEIRSFVEGDYIFYYESRREPVEFHGIIHGKRDVQSIMRERIG
jgi:plasmid stabilization system protein ParE